MGLGGDERTDDLVLLPHPRDPQSSGSRNATTGTTTGTPSKLDNRSSAT
jgi:hypothetical protein